jgi:hypothetical protein
MAGLPKQYARMGFKKGWEEYRKSRSLTRGNKQMAKKKSKKFKKVSRALDPMKILIGAGLYGAVREPAANFITPVTSKIPLGSVADELVLGLLGWFGYKKGKGIVKDISLGALAIEGARIGEQIRKGTLLTEVSSNGANTGSSTFSSVY